MLSPVVRGLPWAPAAAVRSLRTARARGSGWRGGVVAAVGARALVALPPGGPWTCVSWQWARPSVVGLAAGSGGLVPLRTAASKQLGLSRGAARGLLRVAC